MRMLLGPVRESSHAHQAVPSLSKASEGWPCVPVPTSCTDASGGNFPPTPTVHCTSRSFLPARMSIQAAAIFLPSLLTATTGASMGQLSTLLSPWLIRATLEKDAPPFADSARSSARLAFLPPSR